MNTQNLRDKIEVSQWEAPGGGITLRGTLQITRRIDLGADDAKAVASATEYLKDIITGALASGAEPGEPCTKPLNELDPFEVAKPTGKQHESVGALVAAECSPAVQKIFVDQILPDIAKRFEAFCDNIREELKDLTEEQRQQLRKLACTKLDTLGGEEDYFDGIAASIITVYGIGNKPKDQK